MNVFNSKSYPKIMYLALIVVSLFILFNAINILDTANTKMHKKSLTGFVIEDNQTNITKDSSINSTTNPIEKKSELYSSRSYMIFYTFLIGIIMAILITFLVLRSTINKNIEQEEKARKF